MTRHRWYDLAQSRLLRKYLATAAGAGLVCAAAAAWLGGALAPAAAAPAAAAAAVLAFLLAASPLAAAGLAAYHAQEYARQTQSLVAIRGLLGELPPPLGGWAIDPSFGELLVQLIVRQQPSLIVECGAGTSTVLGAAVLKRLGRGRLLSLEHNPAFAEQVRQRLAQQELSEWAQVLAAPLAPHQLDGRTRSWYDPVVLAEIGGGIDLLVVDGPPARPERSARYPAVPLLRGRLSPRCLVLMDDGNRPGEQRIARQWAEQLGARARFLPGGKGAWLLEARESQAGTG